VFDAVHLPASFEILSKLMTGSRDGDLPDTGSSGRAATDDEPNTVLDRPVARDRSAGGREAEPDGTEHGESDRATGEIGAPGAGDAGQMSHAFGSQPGRSTIGTIVSSPLEALHRAEILATRTFCRVGLVIALGAAAAIPLLPGHPFGTYVLLVSIALATGALLYLYRRTRSPETFYDGIGVAVGWYIPAAAVSGAVPFFGPFSAVPILSVLGIYFVGLGASRRLALSLYLTCASVQGISGGLVIAGFADPGFIRSDYLSLRVQILCQMLIQLVLGATFVIARGSRKSSLIALNELERAVRAVAQREALLEEAREELRRAVGSGRGRFTDQVIGRYRLGDLIGRGAMGEVYEAVDPSVKQPVAIKMLSQASLGNAHHVERFMRELRATAAIASPNVIRVLDVGEQPLPHLVMERLRGRDLAAVLRGKSALSHEKVLDLLRQVGSGLTAASAAGIIHRDIKPQNLFLSGTTWKVLDFGVSRVADTGDTLTAGHVVGTPAYMAPEQARGAAVDHRTDLYALAAIAYRTLTGHALFSGGEIADMLFRVVNMPPRRPSSLATLHPDVDLALAIGVAKNPADRFPTADELVAAIADALAGKLSPSLRERGQALVSAGAWVKPLVTRADRVA
jgi:serine/threonine-protein kinase